MSLLHYLDAILVPLSLFVTIGYHGFLWHICKSKPHLTAIGVNNIRRRLWVRSITEDPTDKKLMFAIQSMRNTLMVTILIATLTILLNTALAAYTNNIYKSNHLLKNAFFGLQSSEMIILKYVSASMLLLSGFVCSSVAVGCLGESTILAAAPSLPPGYAQRVMERGFLFSFLSHRMLYITVPLLLWLFGPIPMVLSSAAMVWVLYGMDFAKCDFKEEPLGSSTTHFTD